jgi:ribonuclease BN (tRNA processing enzyme)
MKLTIVGCSGSFPGPDSAASSYLVEADDYQVVLDLGNGALGQLQRYTTLDRPGAVLFSHLHADHVIDLTSYYVVRRYHPDGQMPTLPVYGPHGSSHRMARAYDLPYNPGMTHEFDFRTYSAQPVEIGPFTVTVVPVLHPVEAYAIRLEHGGRTLVYSGDTAPTPTLNRIAEGADVFLCEAAFLSGRQNPAGLHLTGREAGEAATEAGVGGMVITHVPPWGDSARAMAEAKETYAGPLELAAPGMTVEV